MENNLQEFKAKLKALTGLIGNFDASNDQVQQLKQSLFVLNKLLENEVDIPSPYGPHTSIVRYSLN